MDMEQKQCWEVKLLHQMENQFLAHRSETSYFSGTRGELITHLNELHRETGFTHSGCAT